jgi:hypothetical protein
MTSKSDSGRKGGLATGPTKRRNVDYKALQLKSAAKRKQNREKKI